MPHGILTRANAIWNQQHPNTFYGDSYHTMNPASHFEQNLGLIISTAISSHLLRAHNKLRYSKPVSCMDNEDCRCDTSHPNISDDPPSCTTCTMANHTPTTGGNAMHPGNQGKPKHPPAAGRDPQRRILRKSN